MVAPTLGNLVNTPAGWFVVLVFWGSLCFSPASFLRKAVCTTNVAACRLSKSNLTFGKSFKLLKNQDHSETTGLGRGDTQGGWTHHSWPCQETEHQIRKMRTPTTDHTISATILQNTYYQVNWKQLQEPVSREANSLLFPKHGELHSSICSPATVIQTHPNLPIPQHHCNSSYVYRRITSHTKGPEQSNTHYSIYFYRNFYFFFLIMQRFRTVLSHAQETLQSNNVT